jgi:hypothetical protein
MREVLVKAGWTLADSKIFVEAGLLPRIIRASMQYYFYLLLHLRHILVWDPLRIEEWFHTLNTMRPNYETPVPHAVRRSQVLLQSYTYLRTRRLPVL